MVTKFTLMRSPRILFGSGQAEQLPMLLRKQGKRILILTGAKSYMDNKGIGQLLSLLENEKRTLHFDRVEKEPTPEDIDRIVNRFRPLELDAIISIGGGSVIDAGKAVSAMLPLEKGVRDYLEGIGNKIHPGIKKFFAAIPTTSGTGSETTANAVLSGQLEGKGFKRSLRHENFVPDLAIVDPEFTIGCPPQITAFAGMDAFTQLMESYLSTKSGSLTDALALEGIMHVHESLRRAYSDGSDLEARSGMAYAAMLSGITLTNAGLGLIHGFASSVGAVYDVPHGSICGAFMGIVNRANIKSLLQSTKHSGLYDVAKQKYIRLGKLLSSTSGNPDEWYLHFVADYIDNLTEEVNVHLSISDPISNDLEVIASVTDHKFNPIHFEKEELVEMLKARIG